MIHIVEREIAGRTLRIETGRMAKQASGAVYVTYGESAVLVAATSGGLRDLPFFPLTMEYREKTYAAGKIPGGFFKREGAPRNKEKLTARLMDRPIRPLFPDGYKFDTQIYCMVLSSDGENDPALLSIVGASAALMISDIPWDGPVSSVKIGRVAGEYVINPTVQQSEISDLDLVVAVHDDDVVMLEGNAKELSEDAVLEAIATAASAVTEITAMQMELAELVKPDKHEFERFEIPSDILEYIEKQALPKFEAVYGNGEKNALSDVGDEVKEKAIEDLSGKIDDDFSEKELQKAISESVYQVEKVFVRDKILVQKMRYDKREAADVRKITSEIGVLVRPHGSALFTRGETQALVTVTLGSANDEQRVDALLGEYTKKFMMHYNFPPFSVGEAGPIRGPGRREIGHGHLAEMAITQVLPATEKGFDYTIRVVSEILESNGSSSQATICGASLALMNAGVPITASVAGVALGLVANGKDYIILSDIAGVEDHLGDMDLKIAGTKKGITAIQMDLKVEGISLKMLTEALERARVNRITILDCMDETINAPSETMSKYAPRVVSVMIDTDKIGKLIGPGGKNIRGIQESTGVDISVDDTGKVTIMSDDGEAADRALLMVEGSTGTAKLGVIYDGIVANITTFGAFVEIMPGTDGLLHISQICDDRIDRVEDVLKKGQKVRVKVKSIRDDGKINLVMKGIDQNK